MAVISITVTQSDAQVVSGIPKVVTITTNVSSTIFYTLDGSDPTLFSTIYTGPIYLPFDKLVVTLKILATNGTDYSPIVAECYMTDMVDGNARLPHSATTAAAGSVIPDSYPFGTPPYQPQQGYLNPADSGVTVFNPTLPATSTGFNADGYPTGFTNEPYNIENYQISYSTRNAEGEEGAYIGTLPGTTKYVYPPPPPEETEQFSNCFNPKAMVIFQDFSKENPNDPPQINRQFFTLEDPERARDGNFFYNTGLENATVSGSFVRAHYNQRTNEITHYYRDSWSNQWIISTAPYQPNQNAAPDLTGTVRAFGGKVYEWIPFQRRVLF